MTQNPFHAQKQSGFTSCSQSLVSDQKISLTRSGDGCSETCNTAKRVIAVSSIGFMHFSRFKMAVGKFCYGCHRFIFYTRKANILNFARTVESLFSTPLLINAQPSVFQRTFVASRLLDMQAVTPSILHHDCMYSLQETFCLRLYSLLCNVGFCIV